MKTKHLIALFSSLFAFVMLFSCKKEENLPYKNEVPQLPATALNYAEPSVPAIYQDALTARGYDVTDDGATLGRVLFYDKKLSLTNNVSCGSCHLQEKAFADVGKGSLGFDGGVTSRNSMAITNPILEDDFFWDLRETNLEEMVLKPIENHIEMGMEDLDKLPGKLAATSYYPELFEKAFGTSAITEERIADALAQFLNSMLSLNSKADQGTGFTALNAQEQQGMNIFFGQALCYQCHSGNNFNEGFGFFDPTTGGWDDRRAANIGLEMHYEDGGMGANDQSLEGVFKVPSLRNVALTAPYMHDGRFETLEEVVNHYNKNIQNHPNLDPRLRDWEGNPWRLGLNEEQKDALVAFLHALTDEQFTTDERFSNPFNE